MLNLKAFLNKRICVKFNGGREIEGELLTADNGLTVTLAGVIEKLPNKSKMNLGVMHIIVRLDTVVSIYEANAAMAIGDPFMQ